MSNKFRVKLRTAADVISRFRWAKPEEENGGHVYLGYDDRINGPLEMPIQDYVPIKLGGDLPEHRILYFRREASSSTSIGASTTSSSARARAEDIVWDRAGRVDKVFGSGNGPDGAVSEETLEIATNAVENTKRLETEREQKRALKAKERKRKAQARRKKAAAAATFRAIESTKCDSDVTKQAHGKEEQVRRRFDRIPSPVFTFIEPDDKWQVATNKTPQNPLFSLSKKPRVPNDALTVVTWNVLFDVFDDGAAADGVTSVERWKHLANALLQCKADIICLQEATPSLVEVLGTTPWVQESYAMTSSPLDASSVSPHGNLLLWRMDSLTPALSEGAVLVCHDGERRRAVAAALRRDLPAAGDAAVGSQIVLVANVHLPADRVLQPNVDVREEFSRACRGRARRRELTAVVGQLARMEEQCGIAFSGVHSKVNCQSIIAGDFNSEDEELSDGCFSGNSLMGVGYYLDSWTCSLGPGYRYDPTANSRAARSANQVGGKSHGRRIDRIYYKSTAQTMSEAELVTTGDRDGFPSSDHFGVLASFRQQLDVVNDRADSIASSDLSPRHSWAATAMSCPDTILALIFEKDSTDGSLLSDLRSSHGYEDSSLAAPHITLLHGFVELDSTGGSLSLAVETVAEAIAKSNPAGIPEEINFAKDSLEVFIHRTSATVYAAPDLGPESWLHRLYRELRSRFRQCDEQEMHSEGNVWQPHLALGTFGSSTGARSAMREWRQDGGSWQGATVNVNCISLLERGTDGKFYTVAQVSRDGTKTIIGDDAKEGFESNKHADISQSLRQQLMAPPTPLAPFTLQSVIEDAGKSAFEAFQSQSCSSLEILRLACDAAADELGFHCTFEAVGSSRLRASLPFVSDIDAVAVLQAKNSAAPDTPNEESNARQFFELVSSFIRANPNLSARLRMRTAHAGLLSVMTFKLSKHTPSIDLMLAFVDKDGKPRNESAASALANISNSDAIIRAVQSSAEKLVPQEDHELRFVVKEKIVEVFAGSLRLIKLWAVRRDVYSQSAGYLPGGGYATLLARLMCDGLESGGLEVLSGIHGMDAKALSTLSLQVTKFFFQRAAVWPWPQAVTLPRVTSMGYLCVEDGPEASPGSVSSAATNDAATMAIRRGTMAIMSPRFSADHSEANYARSTTLSTTEAMIDEFRQAASLLQGTESPSSLSKSPSQVLQNRSVPDFMNMFSNVISVEVFSKDLNDPTIAYIPDLKAWGSTRMLSFLVSLERRLVPFHLQRCIRLRPRALRSKRREKGLEWLIGVHDVSGAEDLKTIKKMVKKASTEIEEGESNTKIGFSADVHKVADMAWHGLKP